GYELGEALPAHLSAESVEALQALQWFEQRAGVLDVCLEDRRECRELFAPRSALRKGLQGGVEVSDELDQSTGSAGVLLPPVTIRALELFGESVQTLLPLIDSLDDPSLA